MFGQPRDFPWDFASSPELSVQIRSTFQLNNAPISGNGQPSEISLSHVNFSRRTKNFSKRKIDVPAGEAAIAPARTTGTAALLDFFMIAPSCHRHIGVAPALELVASASRVA
jgi:hypothetical protein